MTTTWKLECIAHAPRDLSLKNTNTKFVLLAFFLPVWHLVLSNHVNGRAKQYFVLQIDLLLNQSLKYEVIGSGIRSLLEIVLSCEDNKMVSLNQTLQQCSAESINWSYIDTGPKKQACEKPGYRCSQRQNVISYISTNTSNPAHAGSVKTFEPFRAPREWEIKNTSGESFPR